MQSETLFQKLQHSSAHAWNFLSGFSHEALNAAAGPGKWSALQQMLHIHKSERSFVLLLTRSLQGGKPLKGNPFALYLRRLYYYTRIKAGTRIKAPKVADPSADTVLNPEEVRHAFEKTREQLKTLLESITPEQQKKYWVTHPFLKEMRVNDLLRFLNFHQAHHLKKVYRTGKP